MEYKKFIETILYAPYNENFSNYILQIKNLIFLLHEYVEISNFDKMNFLLDTIFQLILNSI